MIYNIFFNRRNTGINMINDSLVEGHFVRSR